jgi:hypothetical protein
MFRFTTVSELKLYELRACLASRIVSGSPVNRLEQFQTARNWNVSPPNRYRSIREKQLQAWNDRKGVLIDSHLGLPLLPPFPSHAEDESSPTVVAAVPCRSRTTAAAPLRTGVVPRPPLSCATIGASPATRPCPALEPHHSCCLAHPHPCIRATPLPWPSTVRRERAIRLDNEREKERWSENKKERKKERKQEK